MRLHGRGLGIVRLAWKVRGVQPDWDGRGLRGTVRLGWKGVRGYSQAGMEGG